MLGSLILYLKAMRIVMFQLSGFYCRPVPISGSTFFDLCVPALKLSLLHSTAFCNRYSAILGTLKNLSFIQEFWVASRGGIIRAPLS